jgi:RNA polymerase sigma-70 factor (ECF subfamily)
MDRTLIERAQSGDRRSLERLLEELAPLVHRFGLRMCRHEADAEDVLQDTLLSITQHLGQYAGRSSLASWVFMLARTACARRRRGLKNRAPDGTVAPDEVASEGTPEQGVERTEVRRALDDALGQVSEEHREILVLRDMEGLSSAEVADALGIGVAAVKSRLHRARGALRDSLRGVLEPGAPPAQPGCPDILSAFSRKLEGELAAADCAAMEEHMASCASCKAACSALRTALEGCRSSAASPVSRRLQARIKAIVGAIVAERP